MTGDYCSFVPMYTANIFLGSQNDKRSWGIKGNVNVSLKLPGCLAEMIESYTLF